MLLEETLIQNVRSKMEHTTECLQGDSFFNLTRTKILEKNHRIYKKKG